MSVYPKSIQFSDSSAIEVGGVDIKSLVERFGTPLYIMDEATIRSTCQAYQSLQQYYPEVLILYAAKANMNVGLLETIVDEGLGVDVVSAGELYTALKTKVSPTNIYFHGNNKTDDELALALKHGVRIVVDNPYELERLETMVSKQQQAHVLFRLNPEIESVTHRHVQTGQRDSKFGVSRDTVMELVYKTTQHERVHFLGIHSHIGSQILDVEPYKVLIKTMMNLVKDIKESYGEVVQQLNIGGGLGIPYLESEVAPDMTVFLKVISTTVLEQCALLDVSKPRLLLEPGRSIVGNAGMTVYTVGTIKPIDGMKTYVFVDGGMADNMRPALYDSTYTFGAITASKKAEEEHHYTISGRYCESGDILAKDVVLPVLKPEDLLVVYGTGAYNYSMASNYNRTRRPAMVLLRQGKARLLVRREDYDNVLGCDVENASYEVI